MKVFRTGDGYTLFLVNNGSVWVDSLDPEKVDMSFDDGDGVPCDSIGEPLEGFLFEPRSNHLREWFLRKNSPEVWEAVDEGFHIASLNYNNGADTICECYSQEEMAKDLEGCGSLQEIHNLIKEQAQIMVERQLNTRWGEDDDPEKAMSDRFESEWVTPDLRLYKVMVWDAEQMYLRDSQEGPFSSLRAAKQFKDYEVGALTVVMPV